jgi:glycosyltransferase 2 family protein
VDARRDRRWEVTGRRVLRALRFCGYALILGFLGYQLWRVRAGLGTSLRAVGWGNALLVVVISIAGGVPGFFGWRVLLAGLGTRLALTDAARVFFVAGLARYVPGGVWPTLAHAAQARSVKAPPARLAGAFLMSQLLGVVAGVGVGVLALPRLAARDARWWLLLPVLCVALIPVLVPRTLRPLLGLAQRVLRRGDGPPALPSWSTLTASTGLMTAGWLISGLHISMLAIALGAPVGGALLVGVGGFALSVVAGVLTVLMPSGLGAREVVLGLTVAGLLDRPGLITLVALSRILLTVGDLLSTAVVLGLLAWVKRRVPAADPPDVGQPVRWCSGDTDEQQPPLSVESQARDPWGDG